MVVAFLEDRIPGEYEVPVNDLEVGFRKRRPGHGHSSSGGWLW